MPTVETRNGTVDLSEIGSAWNDNRLFDTFDSGKVFSGGPWDLFERNIDNMLDRDGKARALEQVLTLPLRSAPTSIVPADGDSGEAEFVRDCLFRPATDQGMSTPLDLVIGQMTSAVLYRRAFFEIVWGLREGRIVFDKLAFRPARTCQLRRDPNDWSFQGFRQRYRRGDDYKTVDVPAEKAMVFIHGQHRDPLDGISDLRSAYSAFESKQKVRFLWYQFLENQVIPKAIAKTRNGNEQALANKVATLKAGGVLGLSDEDTVEAFESNGQGAAVFQAAIEYLDHEMFASCLAGFADLAGAAASGRGSFALSKDQSDFFLRSRQAVLGEMGATLTNFAIADLCRLNFGANAKVPTFKFGEISGADAADAITMLQAILTAATTNPAVPMEFIHMLVEKVAEYLELDVDKVHKAIEARMEQQSTPSGRFQAGIAAAQQLVQEAGLGANPPAGSVPVAA